MPLLSESPLAVYALAIALAAFLLFLVQPIAGRMLLPWFGGGPAVFSICLCFFQCALLVGYGYAHLLSQRPRRVQIIVHVALLLAALLAPGLVPDADSRPSADAAAATGILSILLVCVGPAFVLLAATSPLLQHWVATTGRSPYRLYALSNVASMAALFSYPLVIEEHLGLAAQGRAFRALQVAFVVASIAAAVRTWRPVDGPMQPPLAPADRDHARRPGSPLLWLLLAAGPSALLVAVTQQISLDVAPMPFLWVLPLGAYLLSFVIAFASDLSARARVRGGCGALAMIACMCAVPCLEGGNAMPLATPILVLPGTLLLLATACHIELHRSRPLATEATLFYLWIAAGGALGGGVMALIPPLVFDRIVDTHLALVLGLGALLIAWRRDGPLSGRPSPLVFLPTMLAALAVAVLIGVDLLCPSFEVVARARSFHGAVAVVRRRDASGDYLAMIHGRIMHGRQYEDPLRQHVATGYYGRHSGGGIVLHEHPAREHGGLDIGVVGLGVGTLAAHARADDRLRFYEISPVVTRFANERFSYLRNCPAEWTIVPGDARLALADEVAAGARPLDALIIDAFSSDAIPRHLLTQECFEIYRARLAPDGVLALHITNRVLDLRPVLRALAADAGMPLVILDQARSTSQPEIDRNRWAILTTNQRFLDSPALASASSTPASDEVAPLLWTDDFGGLRRLFR